MLDESAEQAVALGLRNGCRDAWSALYDGYSADIWRYVARLVGPEAAAVADIVQETFLAAARSARQFDSQRGTLWSWLAGIAHHQSALHWRQLHRVSRLKELAESRAGELHRWLDAAEMVTETWQQTETAELVRGILADLPEDYAALLTAKYLDDCSLDDLSRQWGGSTEAIKSKLARARREFRSRFERLAREPTASARD